MLAFVAGAVQPQGITMQGDAQTSNLGTSTTLGSANIRLKLAQGPELKLQCGILGVQQVTPVTPTAASTTLQFLHTVTCDDRSIFILNSTTVISATGACTAPAMGIVGTFHETSDLTGVAGPYVKRTGHVTIDGTISCGFNKMTIAGTIDPAP